MKRVAKIERVELPEELVDGLLRVLQGQFYGDATAKQWYCDRHFLKVHVVTWPVWHMQERYGVSLKMGRYREIMQEVFQGIKRYGQTGQVKHWPRYLAFCVQEHFRVHGAEYYEEAKRLGTVLETVLDRARGLPAPDPMAAIAHAHRVLKGAGRRKKGSAKQLNFGL